MPEIRAISHRTTNATVLALVTREDLRGRRVVDVGAGEGFFCQALGEHLRASQGIAPAAVLSACDLHPELFRYAGVPCDRIDVSGRLPYADASFDIATSIEVVEHVEDQFRFGRELCRILKPGGRAIVTTPNILNANSRLRFLHSGFGLLFNPLPLDKVDAVHTSGHIHPIDFYHLGYLLRRAGFRRVRVHYDRTKKSGVLWSLLLAPFVFPAHAAFRLGRAWKDRAVFEANRELVNPINSWRMLVSRSIIVEVTK